MFLSVDGLLVSNGSINVPQLSNDIVSSSVDVFTLIGYAMLAAIVLGILYGIYLILK
jgi:hypothetical protein